MISWTIRFSIALIIAGMGVLYLTQNPYGKLSLFICGPFFLTTYSIGWVIRLWKRLDG